MASPQRISRVREQLLRELTDIVGRMKDPRLQLVQIVDVELSTDMSHATIFVSTLGDADDKKQILQGMHRGLGFIRRAIAQRTRLRYAPQLRVAYDNTTERAVRVTALIDSLGGAQHD